MRVATYNIQCADYGKSMDAIRAELVELGVQIVGFQEIDKMTHRSGNIDVLQKICGEDYPYYEYSATMEFDGGHYGIGMASTYPMKLLKTVKYETADFEPRIFMICEIDVNGKKIYAVNTHLSYEDLEIRNEQFKVLADEIKNYAPVVLFGDFNVSSFEEFDAVDLNKVNNNSNRIKSFKDEIPFRCIDNIFYSNEINLLKAELNESESSDHNMIWADISLK